MPDTTQPQPDMIGGVPTPPLAILPRPSRLFSRRAERFAHLAAASANLAPYLEFLAALCRVQARLAAVSFQDAPVPGHRVGGHAQAVKDQRIVDAEVVHRGEQLIGRGRLVRTGVQRAAENAVGVEIGDLRHDRTPFNPAFAFKK